MNSVLNSIRYRILGNLQSLQEISKKDYAEAKARLSNMETFKFNGEEFKVNLKTTEEAQTRVAEFESSDKISEGKGKKKNKSKKKKADGMRSVRKGADKNPKVTKMDFLPSKVLDKIAMDKKLDELVEELDERKKRRKKRKSKKAKPNKYQRKKYKARAGTKRGDTMARLTNKIKKGKKLTQKDYKARDDSEAEERKKKGFKSKPRFDTGMYLSEAKKRELDTFVEMLDERKKRRKKRKKSTKKKKKSSGGKLSAKTKETLKKKAKKRGFTPGSVYAEYRKGLAAYYSSGSRKGMSAHQWAHARVNSANPSKSWAVVKKSKSKKK